MVMLGYEPGGKSYRLFDPAKGRVHVSRDVIFDETRGWNCGEPNDDALVIESWAMPQPLPELRTDSPDVAIAARAVENSEDRSPATVSPLNPTSAPAVDTEEQSAVPKQVRQVEFVSPPREIDHELFDEEDDPKALHRYRRLLDLYDSDMVNPGRAERLLLTPTGEPANLAEAEGNGD